jgi:hypothetical protein
MWRGGVGAAYPLATLSSVGASLAAPCFHFQIPLVEPDARRTSRSAHSSARTRIR